MMPNKLEALRNLHEKLSDLQSQAESAPELVKKPGGRRHLLFHYLVAVGDMMRDLGWHEEKITNILDGAVISLDKVESGITDEMFVGERDKLSGAPLPPSHLQIRGRVAAVQDYLKASGLMKKESAEFVLRTLGSHRVDRLVANRDNRTQTLPTWKTVNRWREDTNARFRGGYDWQEQIFKGTSNTPPKDRARKALQNMGELLDDPMIFPEKSE